MANNGLTDIGKAVGPQNNLAPGQTAVFDRPVAPFAAPSFANPTFAPLPAQTVTTQPPAKPITPEIATSLRDQLFKTNDANSLPALVTAFRSAGIDLSPLLAGTNANLPTGAQPTATPG